MKKIVLTVAAVLTLAGGYVFFSSPCCSAADVCQKICCPDKPDCCHKASTASLDGEIEPTIK